MDICDSLVIRFEGSAGDGILSLGTIVARSAARSGYQVCTLSSFLAEVRGGQSTFQLQLGRCEISSPGGAPNVLVALNDEAVKHQAAAMVDRGLLLCPKPASGISAGVTQVVVDCDAVATEVGGNTRNKNLVAAGVIMKILGIAVETACSAVHDSFAKKGQAAVAAAELALRSAYGLPQANEPSLAKWRLGPSGSPPRMLMSGNEAVALGAIAAGVRYYAGYPITPASEIMEVLAKHFPSVGGRAVQAEDEIASIGMCIGAAFGGAKTLTATSGPGLSLMVELLGLATIAEVPIVVVDVQRSGPSTGMPTKDGQGDLNLAVYGAHGDAPRIVMAPQSVGQCFDDTIRAVNLAHCFHIPVIVLSSQSLSHRMQTLKLRSLDDIKIYEEPLFEAGGGSDAPFRRFRPCDPGRPSVRSIPGTPEGMFRTGGLEHDESGQPSFDAEQRKENVLRRRARLDAVDLFMDEIGGAGHAVPGEESFALVSWGSSAGAAQEALELLQHEKGWNIGHFFPRMVWPVPKRQLVALIASGIETLYVCEANDSQQFAGLIRSACAQELRTHGVDVVGINRDDGSPFTARDIARRLGRKACDCVDDILKTG